MIRQISFRLIFIFLICLIVNNLKSIYKFTKLSQYLKKEKEKLFLLQKNNWDLKEKLNQVNSLEFVEKEAREKLGMGRSGEKFIPKPSLVENPELFKKEASEPNWKKWWKLFFY